MATITNLPQHFKIYGAAFIAAALVAALLLVGTGIGPAQAQNAANTYADPVPCGPGPNTATVNMEEPHELTTGHYALFDSYWQWTHTAASDDPDDTHEGIMHANECPPKMVATTGVDPESEKETVIISRAASGLEVGEAIMHVLDKHKVDVVKTNAEATAGQLSLEEYPGVAVALDLNDDGSVKDGTQVWWLRLDDPDTGTDSNPVDETSDLGVGFSTALFDPKYWLTRATSDTNLPMRYMLETVRYRNVDPASVPHFFAYEAPKPRNGIQLQPVLDSTDADVEEHDMTLDPGEYRSLQWIFTKPGTYELQAHLQGFVRPKSKKPADAGDDWRPISSNRDETSKAKTYVFQVGDKLAETEPPRFGVNRRVHEDAAAGTHVGEPVRVFNADVPGAELNYTLAGEGKEKFGVTGRTHPDAAQIVVASGASLDYDTDSSYNLMLRVSDGKDHEGNNDDSVDHFIVVEIDVIQQPHVYTIVNNHTPTTAETVKFRVNIWGLPEGPEGVDYDTISYVIWESATEGDLGVVYPVRDEDSSGATATLTQSTAGTYRYTPEATYTLNDVEYKLRGDPVTITWRNP